MQIGRAAGVGCHGDLPKAWNRAFSEPISSTRVMRTGINFLSILVVLGRKRARAGPSWRSTLHAS